MLRHCSHKLVWFCFTAVIKPIASVCSHHLKVAGKGVPRTIKYGAKDRIAMDKYILVSNKKPWVVCLQILTVILGPQVGKRIEFVKRKAALFVFDLDDVGLVRDVAVSSIDK